MGAVTKAVEGFGGFAGQYERIEYLHIDARFGEPGENTIDAVLPAVNPGPTGLDDH